LQGRICERANPRARFTSNFLTIGYLIRYDELSDLLGNRKGDMVRPIKTFSVAAITAIAATVLIGTATATATEPTALCKSSEEEKLTCEASPSNLVTEIHATATEPLLHTNVVDVKCTSSLAQASVLALGKPQIAHLKELTWTSCKTHGGTNCTVTTLLLGLIEISKLSTTDAHVKSTGGTAVLVKCGELIHCVYAGEPVLLAEGSPADLKANTTVVETKTHGEKLLCPNTSTWLALYKSLEEVWIRS
jgi:hypothetical protein